MKKVFLLLLLSSSAFGAQEIICPDGSVPKGSTDASAVFAVPASDMPAYLTPVTDPTFGTTITRIGGDVGTSSLPVTGGFGLDVRHHYSTDQPWNSTGTLYAIQNKGGSAQNLYLDAQTFKPKYGKCNNYSSRGDWWHPSKSHSNERVSVGSDGKLSWFDVSRCVQTRSWQTPLMNLRGITEGSSWDGRVTAVTNATETPGTPHQVVVVEMEPAPGRVGPVQNVSLNCGTLCTRMGHIGVSPSGKYLMVSYSGDYVRVFDINPDLTVTPRVISTPTFPGCAVGTGFVYDVGHNNMAPNPFDGNEDVLVGQEHCGNKNKSTVLDSQGKKLGTVLMVRMKDGKITALTDPVNEGDARHISVLSHDLAGWAFVSYHPTYGGTRFRGEVVAVKMDGSKTVHRLAHHHTNYQVYRAEAHAVPSRDGRQVAFASSWSLSCGTKCGSTTEPKDYVINLCAKGGVQTPTPTSTPTATPTVLPTILPTVTPTATPVVCQSMPACTNPYTILPCISQGMVCK